MTARSAREGANPLSPLSTGDVFGEQHSIRALAKSGNFSHKLAKARPLHLDVGERAANIDRRKSDSGCQRAIEQAFAETRRELRREAVADELLDHVIAERDASCQHNMGCDHARELEQRECAWPCAVKRRQPP